MHPLSQALTPKKEELNTELQAVPKIINRRQDTCPDIPGYTLAKVAQEVVG